MFTLKYSLVLHIRRFLFMSFKRKTTMVNFTLKGPRAKLNPQDFPYKMWVNKDTIYKKDVAGYYWPITCLQSIPHSGHDYYMPIDTPFVEEKEFLTFYLDFLTSLDAFRFVELTWEREDLIRISFDATKVTYDYLAILNSLLRNCHTYWHVPYQFHLFSSWELDVDPIKLLVLAHHTPRKEDSWGLSPVPLPLKDSKFVRPYINGQGHSVIYSSMPFELASPDVKLVNPFDTCNEGKKKFNQQKQMKKDGYEYFLHPDSTYKYKVGNIEKYAKIYPDWWTKDEVRRIVHA